MTSKMNGVLTFFIVSLAISSSIEAKSRRVINCLFKSGGKTWTIRNTPAKCCKRKRFMNEWPPPKNEHKNDTFIVSPKISTRSVSECQIFCPLLKALKGCDYICHWYLCNRDTNGDHCQCKAICEKKPVPPVKCGDTEIDLDIFHPLGRTPFVH